jgi:hypothetical protein
LAILPVAGSNTSCAVLSGEDITLTLDPTDAYVSAICRAAGTAVLTIYCGTGQ